MSRERVVGLSELGIGSMVRCQVGDLSALVAHCDDGVVRAVVDQCTHEAANLSDGWLEGCEVECPLHLAVFDLRTGEPLTAPASDPVRVLAVEVEGDDVFIDLGR